MSQPFFCEWNNVMHVLPIGRNQQIFCVQGL